MSEPVQTIEMQGKPRTKSDLGGEALAKTFGVSNWNALPSTVKETWVTRATVTYEAMR